MGFLIKPHFMSKRRSTPTPHDAFFKAALQNPKTAQHFLQCFLSPEALTLLRLETLEPQNVTFIEEHLQESAADILFRLQTHHEHTAYVYTLIEHQRKAEKAMPFRLLRYLIQIMRHHQEQHQTDQLPLVLPLLIYNGQQAYPYSLDLFDLFPPEVREHAQATLVAPYPLIDLSQFDTRAVRDDSWVALMLNALKYGPANISPQALIKHLKEAIVQLAKNQELAYLRLMFYYICEAKDSSYRQALFEAIHHELQPALGENIMTSIADSLRQEGMQQGMQQGIHLARLENARAMLAEGIDESLIAKVTKLSLAQIQAEASKLKKENSRH